MVDPPVRHVGFTRCPEVERRLYADIEPGDLARFWNIYVFSVAGRTRRRWPSPSSPTARCSSSGSITPCSGDERPAAARGLRVLRTTSSISGSRRPGAGVLLITIDRPEVLNAADERLHRELSEVWAVVDADDSVAVSVITGAGRAFSAGGDLAMVERMTTDHAAVVEQWRDAKAVVEEMLASVKPIVSAINGVAVGAGLAVALLADVSIIGESARLSDGHARLGVAAGDHAALLWPLLCGMAKAKYYLMTADFVDGPEAERIGLVTRCVPDERGADRGAGHGRPAGHGQPHGGAVDQAGPQPVAAAGRAGVRRVVGPRDAGLPRARRQRGCGGASASGGRPGSRPAGPPTADRSAGRPRQETVTRVPIGVSG